MIELKINISDCNREVLLKTSAYLTALADDLVGCNSVADNTSNNSELKPVYVDEDGLTTYRETLPKTVPIPQAAASAPTPLNVNVDSKNMFNDDEIIEEEQIITEPQAIDIFKGAKPLIQSQSIPQPPTPAPTPLNVNVDSKGVEFNPEIHSKSKNRSGTWRLKKNVKSNAPSCPPLPIPTPTPLPMNPPPPPTEVLTDNAKIFQSLMLLITEAMSIGKIDRVEIIRLCNSVGAPSPALLADNPEKVKTLTKLIKERIHA